MESGQPLHDLKVVRNFFDALFVIISPWGGVNYVLSSTLSSGGNVCLDARGRTRRRDWLGKSDNLRVQTELAEVRVLMPLTAPFLPWILTSPKGAR